ncbi:T9SS type A sorting domain-containing protein [Flavobacterium rhamnosiphilum]|uniref:T9SS type A sorting domain-containing protein n=1 Tax=Flavobacterium rhamnosiphilum TaxID=2541724 RepID=A0A4V6PGD9_9FLAO|nr:chondroitinase-B domain-containing protein [Flavobacterium rhamnosiphilum]TDE44878.1 T9SS type A sorting domain-containing protein [Flavobacterium rhamnosiphilum]
MNFKFLFAIATIIGFGVNAYSQIVTTASSLQSTVNEAASGATIIVKNGTYADFYATFIKVATVENPITIKAETIGGVILTGDSRFVFKKSAHIIFEGFVFDCTGSNTLMKLEASNNIRITRNVFQLDTPVAIKWIVVGGYYDDYTFQFLSHHNRIDHNIFKNKLTGGNFITIDGTYNQTKTENYQSHHDRIDHNYFYKNAPRAVNEKESIRIGNSQLCNSSGFTTVEFNLFEECDGDPEIVSVKSNDNLIRHNTFNRNHGSLTLRQGNRSRVEGNYFFGGGKANGMFETQPIYTGGIRAYGTDHIIVNNYFEGLQGTVWDAPITLTQGEVITGSSTNYSLHYRGERITIAYNTLVNNAYGIEIGYPKSDGSYNKKLLDIKIANNLVVGSQNNLVKIYTDQQGGVTWFNNIMYATGTAQIVTGGPAFTNDQVVVQNPNLASNGTIWKATSTSPVIANAVPALNVNEDIDGQLRPTISNAGADHFSTGLVTYFPVTIADVGPNAPEETLSVITSNVPAMLLYPNPTKGDFELSVPFLQNELTIELYNIHGQVIAKGIYAVVSGKIQLNLDNQPAGLYILRVNLDGNPVNYRVIKQ